MPVAERFSTEANLPSWIRLQHLERYRWAEQFVQGKDVLDAACGTGFGSRMLALAGALSVRGFDIAPDAVAIAREACADRPQVEIAIGDATQLPLADAAVDVFVCFETIEHVADDRAVVREAARVLRPGGIFLCSTPNRDLTNPGTSLGDRPFNPHHVREYNPDEFAELCRGSFADVTMFGQSLYPRSWQSILRCTSHLHRRLAVWMHQARKLITSPANVAAMHTPREIRAGEVPEFLIAVTRV